MPDFELSAPQALKNLRPSRCASTGSPATPLVASAQGRCGQAFDRRCRSSNMSDDLGQQAISATASPEDIITELSRYRPLLVIARNSCFQFHGPSVDIAAVRRNLGVLFVVEGSIRRSDNRVRITAQLVEAATGHHLWAEPLRSRPPGHLRSAGRVGAGHRRDAGGADRGEWRRPCRAEADRTLGAPMTHFLQGRECVNRYDAAAAKPLFRARHRTGPELCPGTRLAIPGLCPRVLRRWAPCDIGRSTSPRRQGNAARSR